MSEEKKKILVLIYGEPGHGKSKLGELLAYGAKFGILSLDSVYALFVEEKYPGTNIPDLRNHLGQHFNSILEQKLYGEQFANSYKDAWLNHLEEKIEEKLGQHPHLVVEGYYLKDGLREPIIEAFEDEYTIYEIKAILVHHFRDPSGKEINIEELRKSLSEETS